MKINLTLNALILNTIIIFSATTGYSFQLSPIELFFAPNGSESTQTLTVYNSSDKSIPIEVKAFKRTSELSGKEIRTPTQDFLIFPPQTIIKPGERKAIRVSWLGEALNSSNQSKEVKRNRNIKDELAYRISVNQIPVDVTSKTKKKTGINIIYNYVAGAYIVPKKAKANLLVKKAKRLSKNKLQLTINNSGNAHAILNYYKLMYKSPISEAFIEMKGIDKTFYERNILANTSQLINLTLPKKIHSGALVLTLEKK